MSQSVDAHIQQLPSELNAGALSIAVRKNTGAALQATDGEPSALQVDSSGALRVTGSTGGGTITSIVPGTALDQLGKESDKAADLANGPTGVMFLGVRSDRNGGELGTSLVDTDGDYAPMSVNQEGALRVEESCRNVRTAVTITSSSWADGSVEAATSLSGHRGVDFAIVLSGGSATDHLTVEMSSDGSTYYELADYSAVAVTDSGGAQSYVIRGALSGVPAKWIRFANYTGAALTVKSPLFITRHN